jgi:hypothetical protein
MRDESDDISVSPKKVGSSSRDLDACPRREHGSPARVETDSLCYSEFVFYRRTFLAHIQQPWKTLKLKNCHAAPPLSARLRLLEERMGVPPNTVALNRKPRRGLLVRTRATLANTMVPALTSSALLAKRQMNAAGLGVPPVKASNFAAPPVPDRSTYFSTTPNLTHHFAPMN